MAILAEEVVRQSEGGDHPLKDAKFPYRIGVEVLRDETFEPCTLFFEKNRCYVKLNRGERYRIRLRNNSHAPVFACVLVDGLNTLPQAESQGRKDARVERTPDANDIREHPRVPLDRARPWFCAPGCNDTIAGFVKKDLRRHDVFKVTDAAESIAARSNYTEQVGIITAVFYRPRAKQSDTSRGAPLGTTVGRTESRTRQVYQGDDVPGDQIAVINIHYVTEIPPHATPQ